MILMLIAAYLAIGTITTAALIYLDGSLELQHVPWVPLMVTIWPLLVIFFVVTIIRDYIGPWWGNNKYREVWKRK